MNTRIDANLLKENAGLAEQYNVKLAEPEIRAGMVLFSKSVQTTKYC